MTQLAQYLGSLSQGYLNEQWLEEKAEEIRKIVYKEMYEDYILNEMIVDEIIKSI